MSMLITITAHDSGNCQNLVMGNPKICSHGVTHNRQISRAQCDNARYGKNTIFEATQTNFGKTLAYKLWNSIDNT